jgi:hypothetical protein
MSGRTGVTAAITLMVSVAVTISVTGYVIGAAAGRSAQLRQEAAEAAAVQLPESVQAAAGKAAAAGRLFIWTADDGCHTFLRTLDGHVFWIDPAMVDGTPSWDVGLRGWPQAGCGPDAHGKHMPASEPCEVGGPWPCGVGGGYGPADTDQQWLDVTGAAPMHRPPRKTPPHAPPPAPPAPRHT